MRSDTWTLLTRVWPDILNICLGSDRLTLANKGLVQHPNELSEECFMVFFQTRFWHDILTIYLASDTLTLANKSLARHSNKLSDEWYMDSFLIR